MEFPSRRPSVFPHHLRRRSSSPTARSDKINSVPGSGTTAIPPAYTTDEEIFRELSKQFSCKSVFVRVLFGSNIPGSGVLRAVRSNRVLTCSPHRNLLPPSPAIALTLFEARPQVPLLQKLSKFAPLPPDGSGASWGILWLLSRLLSCSTLSSSHPPRGRGTLWGIHGLHCSTVHLFNSLAHRTGGGALGHYETFCDSSSTSQLFSCSTLSRSTGEGGVGETIWDFL
jgi:hypothetical protein